MRVGLSTPPSPPSSDDTPLHRVSPRVLDEVRALRSHVHRLEKVAYFGLAIAAGLLAGVLVVIAIAIANG